MTTTRKTGVGVYSEEFFLRCFLVLIVGFLVLGVLLMGFLLSLLFLLGAKRASMGVTATSYYISRPQAGTERRFLNHESIGTWEFFFFSIRFKSMRAPPFCLIGPLVFFFFGIKIYFFSSLLWHDLIFTVLDV